MVGADELGQVRLEADAVVLALELVGPPLHQRDDLTVVDRYVGFGAVMVLMQQRDVSST